MRLLVSALVAACVLPAPGCGDETPPAATGPHGDVELIVDTLGITHVYGRSDGDALLGAGYAMARDRLFQMELARRRALGTTAELLGDAALKDDQSARTMAFGRLGAADVARLRKERPADAALIDAWCAGVNLRIDEIRAGRAPRPYGFGPGELDFLPAPWVADHALAVGKLLAFGLSNTLDQDVLATALGALAPDVGKHLPILLPAFDTAIVGTPGSTSTTTRPPLPRRTDLPPDARARFRYSPFARDNGSNNWAVDGAHSTNGRPLLCGDPHQQLTSPSRFWPVHIDSARAGGALDVIGFSFAGTPGVQLGMNAHVAWTATTNFADVMDLWDVEPGSGTVTLGDGAHPTVTRHEVIRVRRSGGAFDEVTLDVTDVPGYGVILPEVILPVPKFVIAKGQLLFNWTGFRATTDSASFLGLDRATDLDGFERAVDLLEVGAVNFVAADHTGIDYRSHSDVPDRGDPSKHPMPYHVLAADDRESLWLRGDLPPAKLPHLRAPARGFVLSANNDPYGFTSDGIVENDPFYYGAFFANGFRAHRIDEALTALTRDGKKVSRADMEALQDDVHSGMADVLVPKLVEAVAAIGAEKALEPYRARPELAALAARLGAWDRNMARSSSEAVVLTGLQWFATRRAFSSQLGAPLFDGITSRSAPYLLGALRNVVDRRFPDADRFMPDGLHALLVGALADTADWLVARFGAVDGGYHLEDLQKAAFPNPFGGALDGGRVGVAGGDDTVFVTEGPFFAGGKPVQEIVASESSLYRMVVSFAADGRPEATIDFARGSREDPKDPHFADQQASWVAGEHRPLPFRRAEVEAAATERLTLHPR